MLPAAATASDGRVSVPSDQLLGAQLARQPRTVLLHPLLPRALQRLARLRLRSAGARAKRWSALCVEVGTPAARSTTHRHGVQLDRGALFGGHVLHVDHDAGVHLRPRRRVSQKARRRRRTLSAARHAPCATFPRTAARPRRRTPRRCRMRPGAAGRRRSCAAEGPSAADRASATRASARSAAAAGAAAGAHVSVMTGVLSSEGTSSDATTSERLAARRQLRGASALRAGASGDGTNAARMAAAAARCGAAAQRAGAAAQARALLRTPRTATAAGDAAVSAIAAPHAC